MSACKEVINIVSDCAKSGQIRGPYKVFENTCKGLELIGQPYVVNQNVSDYSWNWIQDSFKGLLEIAVLGKPAVLGPNIAAMPKDLPKYRPGFRDCTYLLPSEWIADIWRQLGFIECDISIWPAGIDCEFFDIDRRNIDSNRVVVYYKNRAPGLLREVIRLLKENNLGPDVITYGKYTKEQYKDALSKCSFGIWIGQPETQGIALLEALAAGLPLIVIDAKSVFDTYPVYKCAFPPSFKSFRTTSAPYFNPRCGVIIDGVEDLCIAFHKIKDADNLNPKEFVREDLSLEISARKLVNMFLHLNVVNCPEVRYKRPTADNFSVILKVNFFLRIHQIFKLYHQLRNRLCIFLRYTIFKTSQTT